MTEQIILSKWREYFKKKGIPYKKLGRTGATLTCMFCEKGVMQVLPNTYKLNCYFCDPKKNLGHYYTIVDIARKLDNLKGTDEEILHHIKEELNLKVITKVDENNIDKYLNFYVKEGFDLVPVAVKCPFCFGKGCPKCDNTGNYGKNPIETDWTNKEHKDKVEWKQWISNGLNIGVKCGQCSNILVVDLDHQEVISDSIKKIMGNTLIQKTAHGFHLFYKYDKDFPKTRIDDLQIDIETTGGQVVIYPSITSNIKRKIDNLVPVIEMPKELKKLLLDKITVPRQTESEKISEDIKTEDFKIDPKELELINNNLEGSCNSSFIKLGGILRKQLNTQQTEYVLHTLNKHLLANPMQSRTITSMVRELYRYNQFDEQELAHEIIKHLKAVEEANRTEIAMTVANTNRGEAKKRVDKALKYLVTNEYVIKRGTKYELIKQLDWSGSLINVGVPVNFKVPYFHDWAYLNKDDVIIIGSRTKYGKTTLAMNFVKRLVEQGITPDYIFNESGGRYAKVALKLGMKDGDFNSAFCSDPDKVILRKNKVTIFDWVKPTNFARTDSLFSDLVEKVKKTNGFLICFVQLRSENDKFFAPDQIAQFPALVAKYVYNNEEGTDTKFLIEDVRASKVKGKKFVIPCVYDWDTHEVKTAYEIEKEDKNGTDPK